MDSFARSIIHNARLEFKDCFKKAFDEIPEDKIEAITKHYGNLQLCFELAENMNSSRHLHLLIPKLIKESEQKYGITFNFQKEFIELMEQK